MGEQNVTVKRAPRPLSPGKVRNSSPTCFASDSAIVIASPLPLAAILKNGPRDGI
jgi:hypothetical protein